ncbi:MAP kinase phosphatase 1 [Chloropicon primus]|uniref:MAP kinase phosphatase 1 n=1 Tax=Chloropicon primus TaxID=1764295 RepID=A0A5B8MKG4_9CHLO|nr:MAP kinase phosphatase 1 [Chloropicon primus]UPQ99963.1 MAP kinase phosphatase 1 [Chloropicon primus]|eukprot:QDZ20751.1 MAP kinase phosphatase 1 [Chloropicon primus]
MEHAALFPHKSFQDKSEKEPVQLNKTIFTRSRSENLTLPGKSLTIDTSLMVPDQRSPASPAVKALDLSSSSNENSLSLERGNKIRLYERECSEVAPSLFMSGDTVAKMHEILVENGITHIVNCVGFTCGEYHKDKGLKYLTLYLEDSPNQDIGRVLYHVFDFIEAAHAESGKVLVHCTQGISRSAALCISFIMHTKKVSYEEAFQGVKAVRRVTNPNIGFTCQLLHWQKQLEVAASSHTRERAMYNIAPFSRMDSKLLVLKHVKSRTVKLLDPRGVFVVEGEQKMFVWHGSRSLEEHREGSRGLIAKLFKYELDQSLPTEEIKQGGETREFLLVLGVTKTFRSLKKLPELEAYDRDYSLLYQDPSGNLF